MGATAKRSEAAKEKGEKDFTDGPAWVVGSAPPSKELPQASYVFSVKNSFLEVQEAQDPASEGSDCEIEQNLPPALDIIPASVSAEKLAAFRADYARFRVGNAIGAKGEIDKTID